ncbi:MAG: PTS sugar transporter subunit IIA [Phycisphaerae bacterium]|nr:PTS sugar transporter subunit IIA [Phycisphaerae bacterium]
MPFRSLTLKELAKMMGADSRRLERMAQRGEIPCQKVGGEFRFNRAEITQWLQQHMGTFHSDHLEEVDAGMTAHRQTHQTQRMIIPLIRPEAVTHCLEARSKNGAIRSLISLAQATGLVYNGDTLLEAVLHREELCTTAMEGGLAMPHPRCPLPYDIADTILVVARAQHGILFGAPDGPTRLFFFTASQDDTHHLHVLARIFRLLRHDDLLENLIHADTAQHMIDLITDCETNLMK